MKEYKGERFYRETRATASFGEISEVRRIVIAREVMQN
jgi:alkylation response protein AidB-like acyl-CoA dehydrogenase